MARRIVVIAPHADDAELGVGGYIHRETSAGRASVEVYVLAGGSNSTTRSKTKTLQQDREQEGQKAGQLLGVASYQFINAAADSGFNAEPAGCLVRRIEKVLFTAPIDELFFPLPSFHEDHQVTHRAVIAALRPHHERPRPRRVLCYEYPVQFWGPQAPEWGRVYAPISEADLVSKIEALDCHKSQWVSDASSVLGEAGVRLMAKTRGMECGSAAAELFFELYGTM